MISKIAIIPVILIGGIAAFVFDLDGLVVSLVSLAIGIACVAADSILERRMHEGDPRPHHGSRMGKSRFGSGREL